MLIEITHIYNEPPSFYSKTVTKEQMEFVSIKEAQQYCRQHSNRNEFIRVTKVIEEAPKMT